jgi:hypothetical protein
VTQDSSVVLPESRGEGSGIFPTPWNAPPQDERTFDQSLSDYQLPPVLPADASTANLHPPLIYPYSENQYAGAINEQETPSLVPQAPGNGHNQNERGSYS